MTSRVALMTLRAQRLVPARCVIEKGQELPVAACATGRIFPIFGQVAGSRSLRMQPGVRRRDPHVSNA
ncbi:hypothetical protein DF032_21740 [Burkholderia seminalis]|nr:hypothetical protein DF032_21740 [Burkholderia seminalis]